MAWHTTCDKATVYTDHDSADLAARKIRGHDWWTIEVVAADDGYIIHRKLFPDDGKSREYWKARPVKVKPVILPNEVWTDAFITHNVLGSITHVSSGNFFFATEEECQRYIDTRPGWIGGGGPSSYRPIRLVKGNNNG